ncbi:MAG: hypothetical protein PHX74_05755 [Candidatus Sumerlaeales bacterium]|nr:hypothetical protein [Candidatus Sumerlaeales bacterium]
MYNDYGDGYYYDYEDCFYNRPIGIPYYVGSLSGSVSSGWGFSDLVSDIHSYKDLYAFISIVCVMIIFGFAGILTILIVSCVTVSVLFSVLELLFRVLLFFYYYFCY